MSLGTDIKRYSRGALPRIALAVVVLLPLLYGAMYLWAFWNPFNEVNRVPVALVNADTGTVVDGKPLHAGDQVAQALMDSGQLDLHEMSAEQAAAGVSSGKYYFSISLPENFSARIASPTGKNPEQAQVEFTFNGANNYLASIIGQNAAREVINEVNAEIGQQAVETVLTGLTDAGAGLGRAADGAQQLATGSRALSTGLTTARDGSAQLAAGTKQLRTGVDKALTPMIDVLADLDTLEVNPDDIAEAAGHLAAAVRSTSKRVEALNLNYGQAAVVVDQVVATLRNSPDETVRHTGDFLASAQRLMRAKDLDPATPAGLAKLRENSAKLEHDLADPTSKLRVFLTKATSGELRRDAIKLRDGVDALDNGARALNRGMVQLADGAVKVADGNAELAEQLRAGTAQVPSWTPEQRAATAKTLAAPAKLQLIEHNPVATFGTGFAPFFMPLALFIGALIVWMVLKPLQARPIVSGLSGLRVALASYWPGLLIVVAQVAVMYVVVHFGVGLNAKYPLATVAFLTLVSAAFLAMIQAFNAVFGVAVGRVVTLAFLMFQLVSAGGIYPVETTAKPFQWIHPFDPMTYAVNGLRQLTVGGIDARLWIATAVLAGILAGSLALSSWSARRNRQYTMERLYPPIEV